MPSWLAFAVTAGFALAALWLTIRAWQVRSTTPRTISLAFSSAACIATLIAAADLEIPLHARLCEHPLDRGGELADDLERDLGRWTWRLSPCRRLQVEPTLEDLATPVDFPRLAALAAEVGISIDVGLPPAVPRLDDPLRLAFQGHYLTPNTPIPASRTGDVYPQFVDAADTPLSCRIDHGPWGIGASLDGLLKRRDGELDRGFHRLQCHVNGTSTDSSVFAYIHISSARVLLISDHDPDPKTTEFTRTASTSSFELDRMTPTREQPFSQADRESMAEPATMLIFDRPALPASCVRARDALAHGTSIVFAMPDPSLVAACPDLLPIQPGGTGDERKPAIFDRKPRLTYILDDFARGLDREPSCIIPNCQGKLATPSRIPLISQDVQMKAVHESCVVLTRDVFSEAPHCNDVELSRLTEDANTLVRVLGDPRGQIPGQKDSERLQHSAPAVATKSIAAEFAKQLAPIYRENELIIVFTHDHRSSAVPPDMLEQGARVHVIGVKDPYASSLSDLFGLQAVPRDATELYLVDDAQKRGRRTMSECDEWRCVELPDDLLLVDDTLQTKATMAKLNSRFLPVDVSTEFQQPAAPVRFGWWEPVASVGRLGASRIATTTTSSGLRERPLAMGMMVGRGHLLVLSYSPFESWELWDGAPKSHLEVLDGHRLIENLHGNTSSMSTGTEPTVRSAALRPDGAVWLTMIRAANEESIPEHMLFTAANGGKAIDAPLVDFDDTRGLFTYALPAHELSALSTCSEYHHERSTRRDSVFACPPSDIARSAGTMHAATLLRMLAHYTGGRDLKAIADPSDGDSMPTRPVGLATLSLILLAAWGRRAARRLSGAFVHRRLRHLEQAAQRRYDPPDAVVAAAGDWDGRSSTWPRTGAFGGYRPLEAGDRPSAIVLQDLMLPELGGPRLVPRVMQRIEEAAPTVVVLVNLGESMRVPGRDVDGKAMFAGHVAMHVAASAWKIRGEVEIHAVGVAGESEVIAPTRLSPGHEELDANLRACLLRPAHRERTPWPEDPPECGSIVYVSDFQLEDTHAFQAWATRLEGAGIRVGGVMIYSPLEFTMIEGGRLAGSGVWADRTDWDPDDVFAAFSRRRDTIEQIFDGATTGGLVVASTQFNADDVAIALESGRLLQILR